MNERVYIGWDDREFQAYQVAESSLLRHSPTAQVTRLNARRLADQGLLTRPTDRRGQKYDLISNAPMSTEFAISRFCVPFLAHEGWALFTDCDVVFLDDVAKLFALRDETKAVMCVQHDLHTIEKQTKMDGQEQTLYYRKNWSSVLLWNCCHPANARLSLHDVNSRPGRDLHRFYWLAEHEIGQLPDEWNWLVGIEPMPRSPKIAHFTLGGPWFSGWEGGPHDEVWLQAEDQRIEGLPRTADAAA